MNVNKISQNSFQLIKNNFSLIASVEICDRSHSLFFLQPVKLLFITSSPTAILCPPLAFSQHLSCHGVLEVCDLGGPLLGSVVAVGLTLTFAVP